MKILFVVPYVPDLIRVRPYNLIRFLTQLGHEVTVLTLWTHVVERQAARRLEQQCSTVQAFYLPKWQSYFNVLKTVPGRVPLQASYCWHPALVQHAIQLLEAQPENSRFDVIHVEHLRGVRLGLALKQRLKTPIVWDSVDSISYLFRQAMDNSKRGFDRLITRFELGRTERYEGWVVDQFARTLVTSQADKTALEALRLKPQPANMPSNIAIIQNGVDLEFFKPAPEMPRDPATLVLSGKMSYHANIAMALYLVQEIMPKVWAARADVQVNIVGKDPPAIIQSLTKNPNIHVTGTVPDLRPYLQQATLSVAPITYGAGIQNKILEAMACATPVITTPKAASGLQVIPNENILIAHEADSFAAEILKLLDSPERQQHIGIAGRGYVEKFHHWGEMASQLSQIYTQVIRN